jgi:hypothetical protein
MIWYGIRAERGLYQQGKSQKYWKCDLEGGIYISIILPRVVP